MKIKATSWDKVPATIFELIVSKVNNDELLYADELNMTPEEMLSIKLMISDRVSGNLKHFNPSELITILLVYLKRLILEGVSSSHCLGRMILIHKNRTKLPSIKNLRPITIQSVFIKLIEAIVLKTTKKIFLSSFHVN